MAGLLVKHVSVTVIFERVRPDDYLTRLAASDLGRSYKSLVVTEMGIGSGERVLDLGCGPGADLLAFAGAVGDAGSVLGVDHDEPAVEQARTLVAARSNVAVEVADIHSLALAEGSVDRVHTDRVMQHVADPAAVLREAARVMRTGGRAVFAEPDWDSLLIDDTDPEVPVAYRRYIVEDVVRNARIGRQLPRLAAEARLTVTRVIPITTVFRDAAQADKVLGLQRVTERAIRAGYLTSAAGKQWLTRLKTRPFFASVTLFIVVAEG